MDFHDFVKLLRNRWVTVFVTGLVTLLATIAYTFIQTPLYQASTRLFVTSVAGTSVSDLYSGNRLSQERVLSYAQLIMGETLAQRTIDRLNLDIDATDLTESITARVKPETVLIDVSVLDGSPVRARDIANALSDEFVVMVRELETPTPGAPPDARLVVEQRATVPPKPVVPKKRQNLAIGILVGGILGIGIAFLRDVLDNTVKDRDELERITGAGVVGIVPFDRSRRESPAIVFENDNSPAAESFRKLRTNLQFLSVDNPPRLIVVTSSVPNEGKSTTAINIALALAEAEHNVLLLDGDMRRPSLDKYLDVVGSVGFSSVLSGGAPLEEVVQDTKFPRLSVLAAGAIPPNPSELLGSLAAQKLLSDLRTKYDYVVVDSPPLLAVTDGAILATVADGTIVLVRAGETKREQLTHATGILKDVGATILGSVLTMVPTRGTSAYSYSYSYYGHRYGVDTTTLAAQTDHPTKDRRNSKIRRQAKP